jgi:hypothetical protein
MGRSLLGFARFVAHFTFLRVKEKAPVSLEQSAVIISVTAMTVKET